MGGKGGQGPGRQVVVVVCCQFWTLPRPSPIVPSLPVARRGAGSLREDRLHDMASIVGACVVFVVGVWSLNWAPMAGAKR